MHGGGDSGKGQRAPLLPPPPRRSPSPPPPSKPAPMGGKTTIAALPGHRRPEPGRGKLPRHPPPPHGPRMHALRASPTPLTGQTDDSQTPSHGYTASPSQYSHPSHPSHPSHSPRGSPGLQCPPGSGRPSTPRVAEAQETRPQGKTAPLGPLPEGHQDTGVVWGQLALPRPSHQAGAGDRDTSSHRALPRHLSTLAVRRLRVTHSSGDFCSHETL